MIKVKNLTKHFGAKRAVDDISFTSAPTAPANPPPCA
jgi:ABC-type multidrug transport system ATPase subunit